MLAAGAVVTWLYFKNTLETHLELWLQYRSTSEQLKREKYLFLTKTGTYFDNFENIANNEIKVSSPIDTNVFSYRKNL